MKHVKRYGWLLLVVSLAQAKPQTQDELLLSDTEFGLQELTGNNFDLLYFLPDDAPRALRVIRGLIMCAKKEIKAALFRLTEPSIARALIDAHKRGVAVEVVVDPGALEAGHYSKVMQLVKAEVPVYCYQTTDLFPLSKAGKASYQTIMHHKTLVLDVDEQKIVVFGSLNLTHAGFNGNEECVALRNASAVVQAFEEHLDKLKRRSEQLSAEQITSRHKKSVPVVVEQSVGLASASEKSTGLVGRVIAQGVPYIKRVLRVVH